MNTHAKHFEITSVKERVASAVYAVVLTALVFSAVGFGLDTATMTEAANMVHTDSITVTATRLS
jgi:hypothetical protein